MGRTERVKRKAGLRKVALAPVSPKADACTAEAPQARRRVENLLMNGEFPVEYTTTKFFFHRIGCESSRTGRCDRPSYFVSLVSRFALRRILAAPLFIFLHINCCAAPP